MWWRKRRKKRRKKKWRKKMRKPQVPTQSQAPRKKPLGLKENADDHKWSWVPLHFITSWDAFPALPHKAFPKGLFALAQQRWRCPSDGYGV